MKTTTKTNAITSALSAVAAHAVIATLPKTPKASSLPKTTKPAKPTALAVPVVVAAWRIALDTQVAAFCVGSETLDGLMEQIKMSITGQTRDDVRSALLHAVSVHYKIALVATKSPKKSEAGKMVLDTANPACDRANKRLQRLVMAVLPAETNDDETEDEAGEELCKKEDAPISAQQKIIIDAIDAAVGKAGLTDTKKDKALLIAALKAAIAAYK